MNLYAYVGNGPVNLSDPTGRQALAFGHRITLPSTDPAQVSFTENAIATGNARVIPPLAAAYAVPAFCASGGCGVLALEMLAGESLGPAGLSSIGGTSALALTRSGVPEKVTVLGENMLERVIPYAKATGARTLPFGTTDDAWRAMSPAARYRLNDGTLRARIREGDSFQYIGQDAYRDPALRTKFDLTGSELLRLRDRGVPYETVSIEDVWQAIGRP